MSVLYIFFTISEATKGLRGRNLTSGPDPLNGEQDDLTSGRDLYAELEKLKSEADPLDGELDNLESDSQTNMLNSEEWLELMLNAHAQIPGAIDMVGMDYYDDEYENSLDLYEVPPPKAIPMGKKYLWDPQVQRWRYNWIRGFESSILDWQKQLRGIRGRRLDADDDDQYSDFYLRENAMEDDDRIQVAELKRAAMLNYTFKSKPRPSSPKRADVEVPDQNASFKLDEEDIAFLDMEMSGNSISDSENNRRWSDPELSETQQTEPPPKSTSQLPDSLTATSPYAKYYALIQATGIAISKDLNSPPVFGMQPGVENSKGDYVMARERAGRTWQEWAKFADLIQTQIEKADETLDMMTAATDRTDYEDIKQHAFTLYVKELIKSSYEDTLQRRVEDNAMKNTDPVGYSRMMRERERRGNSNLPSLMDLLLAVREESTRTHYGPEQYRKDVEQAKKQKALEKEKKSQELQEMPKSVDEGLIAELRKFSLSEAKREQAEHFAAHHTGPTAEAARRYVTQAEEREALLRLIAETQVHAAELRKNQIRYLKATKARWVEEKEQHEQDLESGKAFYEEQVGERWHGFEEFDAEEAELFGEASAGSFAFGDLDNADEVILFEGFGQESLEESFPSQFEGFGQKLSEGSFLSQFEAFGQAFPEESFLSLLALDNNTEWNIIMSETAHFFDDVASQEEEMQKDVATATWVEDEAQPKKDFVVDDDDESDEIFGYDQPLFLARGS